MAWPAVLHVRLGHVDHDDGGHRVREDRRTLGEPLVSLYIWMLVGGYGIGLPTGSIAAFLAYRQGFEPLQTVFVFTTYQAARVAMTLGHMSVLLLICKAGALPGLQRRLAAVGQMA